MSRNSSVPPIYPALASPAWPAGAVYLDSAASTLCPQPVIDAVAAALALPGSAHRGGHPSVQASTAAYEQTRAAVQDLLGDGTPGARSGSVLFTRHTTEALNAVAYGHALGMLDPGDEILLSEDAHHSHILPWQRVAARTGARLVIAEADPAFGHVTPDVLWAAVTPRTRLAALSHASNVTGHVLDVARIGPRLRARGITVVVDGAQAAAHAAVHVDAMGCDFYAASSHKLHGPDGLGFLWMRETHLARFAPLSLGGGMVQHADMHHHVPHTGLRGRMAGTPPGSLVAGLAAALAHVQHVVKPDAPRVHALAADARTRLAALDGVAILGSTAPAPQSAGRAPLVAFRMAGVHAHDVAGILASHGLTLRAGHLCAQPLLHRLGTDACVRASFAHHNTAADVERLVAATTAALELRADP